MYIIFSFYVVDILVNTDNGLGRKIQHHGKSLSRKLLGMVHFRQEDEILAVHIAAYGIKTSAKLDESIVCHILLYPKHPCRSGNQLVHRYAGVTVVGIMA